MVKPVKHAVYPTSFGHMHIITLRPGKPLSLGFFIHVPKRKCFLCRLKKRLGAGVNEM